MILQRLGTAIRRQDWTTVVLEIAIVVLGIFIALQVDDWNESRKLRDEQAAYLTALSDDLETMLADLDRRMQDNRRRSAAMQQGLAALQACEDSPEGRAGVQLALDQYQVARSIVYVGATYEEMVAVGALASLDDLTLKRDIASTFSMLERSSEFLRTVRVSLPVVDQIFWSQVDYSVDERGRFRARVDIPGLCRSREVRNAFVEIIDIQGDSHSYMAESRDRVAALLERMGERAAE